MSLLRSSGPVKKVPHLRGMQLQSKEHLPTGSQGLEERMFCGFRPGTITASKISQMSIANAVLVTAILLSPTVCSAQVTETGFLDRSLTLDGVEYAYTVYVPRNYRESESWPVIMYLHGGGYRGTDGTRPTQDALGRMIRRNVDLFPAIVIFPQAPDDWQRMGAQIAIASLDRTLAEFHTDSSRVYLVGWSMGGNGVWYLGYHHPERFAALVPMSGWIRTRISGGLGYRYPTIPSDESADPFGEVAARVRGIPTWVFHGEVDPVVPVEDSRLMAAAIEATGTEVHYTEFPGLEHGAVTPALEMEELPAWLFSQRRR